MTYIRRSEARGRANFGWLDSRHSFSFGQYYDPAHMGFSALRVINDDDIAPGGGFDTHGHRDMEIITYVTHGQLAHKDTLGNESIIRPGEVQRMTAGTGIMHSEFNASQSEPVQLLQIWIEPAETGLTPGYEQRAIPQVSAMTPLVTADGRDGSLKVHQAAEMHRLKLAAGETVRIEAPQSGYLHIVKGAASINIDDTSDELDSGDAVGIQ